MERKRRDAGCGCTRKLWNANAIAARITELDSRLSSLVIDLTAANQNDVNLYLTHQLDAMLHANASSQGLPDAHAKFDELLTLADSSMAYGAGPRVNPDFWVTVAVQGGAPPGLTRSMAVGPPPESRLRLTDKPVVLLRASCDCYVYMFALGPSGTVVELLPSAFKPQADNFLRAGVLRAVPSPSGSDGFEFSFVPPAGRESVYVVATRRPWLGWRDRLLAPESGPARTRAMYASLANFLRGEAAALGLATCIYRFEVLA